MSRPATKYTAKTLKFVQDNLIALGFDKCAEKLQVTGAALKKQISEWRRQEIDIPHLRTVKVGTITTRTHQGITYQFEKTESGWKKLGRITPYVNRACITNKSKGLPKKVAKVKPEVKRLPDRIEPPSEYRMTWIPERRLWVNKKIA